MTGSSVAVQRAPPSGRGWFRERVLARCGSAFLVLVPAGVVWAWCDPRTIEGESVALKPIRFALSIGVYMLTASSMFECVRPQRRFAILPRTTVWMMIVGSTVELLCITFQAARARRSHFNHSTRGDAAIYATMGAFAVLFIGALVPLAWEIWRRPNEQVDRTMSRAIVAAGLLMTVLVGGGTGGLMSAKGRHTIGRESARLPLLGWDMSGGDIRVPHFLGIHAMQALPMIAACARAFRPSRGKAVFTVGAVAYGLLTASLLHRALSAKTAAKI